MADSGVCRFNPPSVQIVDMGGDDGLTPMTVWPLTGSTDYCGKFLRHKQVAGNDVACTYCQHWQEQEEEAPAEKPDEEED